VAGVRSRGGGSAPVEAHGRSGSIKVSTLILVIGVVLVWALVIAKWAGAAYPFNQNLRQQVYLTDPCLAEIIDHETMYTWSPTIYNGGSHWHPGDRPKDLSYGLPQSYPAEKMASAGPDWRTSPWTQLRWMRSYVKARYGSACAALRFWFRNGWY